MNSKQIAQIVKAQIEDLKSDSEAYKQASERKLKLAAELEKLHACLEKSDFEIGGGRSVLSAT